MFIRWNRLGVNHEKVYLFGRAFDTYVIAVFGKIGYWRRIDPSFPGKFDARASGERESWPRCKDADK